MGCIHSLNPKRLPVACPEQPATFTCTSTVLSHKVRILKAFLTSLYPAFAPPFRIAVVAEGKENGFRPRCEAWDEFVYGSHVLLRQERASGLRQSAAGGDDAVGVPSESRACYARRW